MGESDHTERLRNAALAVIALGVLLAGLAYGRSFLIPLAIAILLWNLLEAVIERFARIRIGDTQLPRWFAALLGIAVVVLGLYIIQSILLGQRTTFPILARRPLYPCAVRHAGVLYRPGAQPDRDTARDRQRVGVDADGCTHST
jgi:AI-2 transport protein TqsA